MLLRSYTLTRKKVRVDIQAKAQKKDRKYLVCQSHMTNQDLLSLYVGRNLYPIKENNFSAQY